MELDADSVVVIASGPVFDSICAATDAYFELYRDDFGHTVCNLDGKFSAAELRAVADGMEKA